MSTLRTLTLNSGFDDTFEVTGVAWGGVERVTEFASVPSGKGVNAARTAAALGAAVRAYALVGAADLDVFAGALDREGIGHRLAAVPGPTRHNLTLALASGQQVAAHMVGPGFDLADPGPVAALLQQVAADCRAGDVVTCNGSVPRGAPTSVWADAVRSAARAGAGVVVDAQGEAMRLALRAGPVAAAAPNDEEIAALPGVGAAGDPVAAALHTMADLGVQVPMVTLGARGAAYLDDGRVRRADCPVLRPLRSVGAGDAFVAGVATVLLAGRRDPAAVVSAGLAAAAGHVAGLAGAALAEGFADDLRRVRLDRDPLSG